MNGLSVRGLALPIARERFQLVQLWTRGTIGDEKRDEGEKRDGCQEGPTKSLHSSSLRRVPVIGNLIKLRISASGRGSRPNRGHGRRGPPRSRNAHVSR